MPAALRRQAHGRRGVGGGARGQVGSERRRDCGGAGGGIVRYCRGFCTPQRVRRMPSLCTSNRFSVLHHYEPEIAEDVPLPPSATSPPPASPIPPLSTCPRRSRWEARVKRDLKIRSLVEDCKGDCAEWARGGSHSASRG